MNLKFWESKNKPEQPKKPNEASLTLSTVTKGMRRDNFIRWQGDIVWQTIQTDNAKRFKGTTGGNIKPQYLNQLYRQSPLHSSILNYKIDEVLDCLRYEMKPNISAKEKVAVNKWLKHTVKTKSDFDGFDDFVKYILTDWFVHGNVYIKIKKKAGEIISIEHVPADRVRIKADKMSYEITGYAFSFDWVYKTQNQHIAKYDPLIQNGEFMLSLRNMIPGTIFYGDAKYISAIDSIELDANIAMFHSQNIINGIAPSQIMTFFEWPTDPEGLREFKKEILELTSPDNNGRLLTNFVSDPSKAPKIESTKKSQLDKEFLQLMDDIQRNICYAHHIDPSIMGLKTPGSLGNSQEIEHQTKEFKKTLNTDKKEISKLLNKLIGLSGVDGLDFSFDLEEK